MLKEIKILLLCGVNLFVRHFYKKPNVLSDDQTVEYIVKHNCSISRYGDGELSLIRKIEIRFQPANEELRKKLLEIARLNEDNFLVCIPDVFNNERFNKDTLIPKAHYFWKMEKIKREFLWRKHFNKSKVLGDAFISRFYLRKKDKSEVGTYVQKLKLIWKNRDIIFVEGKNSRLGYGNDLFDNAKSIKRILCPAENAFIKYNEILTSVKTNAKKDNLLILALGPTATVLAFDLYKAGFQALDLGHIDIEYEWFKMKATSRVPVPGKHVNECNDMGEMNKENLNQNYLKQILEEIK